MDAEECKILHRAIREGDVDLVSRLIENNAAEQYFLHEETSALFHAFSEKKYDIATFLLSKGAKIHDSEMDDLYDLEIDLSLVNHLLKHYNKKSDKSCVDKLMFVSWSRQGFDGPHRKAVRTMYKDLFESDIIKLLMMVLETIAFDVFYDFESEDVNRLHRLEVEEMEIYGLTLSNLKEIYVGAKNLMSTDTRKKAKVYGVVAEEMCHLAMTTLFENGAKPYGKEQTKLSEEFWNIIRAVKSLAGRSCHLESSIKTIFTDYHVKQWECELIARVPHVIGIYGEETGRGILMESSELSRLLSFYEKNVIPKCREYTDPRLNTKSHRIMEELMVKHNLISSTEKQIQPLKEGFPPFSEYLEDFPSFPEHPELKRKGIKVLTTNCTKLCTLHVFHELKEKYGDSLKKKVLFFSRSCIEKENDKIINALKGNVWDYFILVMDKKALNLLIFYFDYLENLNAFLIKGMKIIMITSSQSIDQKFNFQRTINYKWDDLTYEYKGKLEIIHILFKGQEKYVYIEKGDFTKYFNEDDIMQIIGEVIEVDDGRDLFSQGYIPETYIERAFTVTTVNGEFFDNIFRDTSVFLSGFGKKDFEEGLIENIRVQWMEKSDDIMQEDKSVYISRGNDFTTFMDLVGKNPRKTTIWLHHEKKVFYLKNSNSAWDEFKQHTKEVSFSEKEILDFLKRKRILIISDNAGSGKSTVVSNLISTVRKNRSDSWIWRIDFNMFSNDEKDPLSLANLNPSSNEEEVIDHLCLMLRLNGGFEKYLFKKFSCREEHCFIFFDGYDEIPSKYMKSALKILSTLKEKTEVKLIIMTRKHHQEELEKTLDTYSHRLVPLSKIYQQKFMNKLWKNMLKDPKGQGQQRSKKYVTEKIKNIIDESKKEGTTLEYKVLIHELEEIDQEKSLNFILSDIENLDFTKFAEFILEKSSLDKESLEFIGIPLHLYMIGIINFNNNFNVEAAYDINSLYNKFLDQKILIYIEEKQNLRKEGKLKEKMVKNTRKDAFRIHTDLSIQLIDEEKICLASDLDEDDLELCIGLGVVYEHGGEIRFLHQTFAEFFIAESVRKNVRIEDINKLISHYKYKVIRRFLSSSLENNSFEKVSKECFNICCFSDVMGRAKILVIHYNSDSFCSAKIIKSLLLNFEQNVEVSVVNKFFEEIESRIESMSYVGGFLSVPMMKHLLNKNFEVNSVLFLHFVRFAESAKEVIDVLTECIPFGSDGGPGSSLHKRSKRRRKNIDKEDTRLVLLFRKKDSQENCLLHHAIRNERFEIFAHILKFFRDRLGKEQFLERIIKSDEYKNELGKFIFFVDIDRFCSFIKALHNVFDNETEILIDNDLKFMLIRFFFDKPYHKHEKVLPIPKLISIFQECLDSEQLKELFLCCASDGDYLIHILMRECSLTQTLIDNLNSVKGFVGDDSFKELLKSKNSDNQNIFHLAVSDKNASLEGIIQYYDNILGKQETKELLLSKDEDDFNVIPLLILFNSPEILINNLNSVRGIIGDECFKQSLQSIVSDNENIFHFAARKNIILKGIIQYCDNILGKEETKELLLSKDNNDRNLIHSLFEYNSSKILIDNLNSARGIIGDECFKKLLKSKDSDSKNIFHFTPLGKSILEGIIPYCDNILGKEETKELLLWKDNDDCNVIHCLFRYNSPELLIDNLNSVRGNIGEDCFKQLLKSKNSNNENIFHSAAHRNRILEGIIPYCENILGKEETKELLLSKDNNDCNVIHCLFRYSSPELLIDNLNSIKGVIGDECFKQLLKSKTCLNENIFHFAACSDHRIVYTFLSLYLCEKEIADLLLERTVFGRTCLHVAAETEGMNLTDLMDYARQLLRCESRFDEFLLAKDDNGNTFFHSMIESIPEANDAFHIFDLMKHKVSTDVFNKLLMVRNKKGKTFLQMDSKYMKNIIKYFQGIFEKDMFEELMKVTETEIMQEEH